MENPATWDRLTAALAVCDLRRADEAWAFVCDVGLVASRPGAQEAFATALRETLEEGPITGPSEAARAAWRVGEAGIALPSARERDPYGDRAKAEHDTWKAGHPAPKPAPPIFDELYCRRCGARSPLRYADASARELAGCQGCGGRLVDPATLLCELGLISLTRRDCPSCGSANLFDPYCYRCGHGF